MVGCGVLHETMSLSYHLSVFAHAHVPPLVHWQTSVEHVEGRMPKQALASHASAAVVCSSKRFCGPWDGPAPLTVDASICMTCSAPVSSMA